MIPLLTLGIPGDVVTSVMLGYLMIIGVQPGPLLFSQSPQIITDLFIGFLFAQFIMVALGYLSIRAPI